MGGSPHILAQEKSEGATVRDSTPIRKETFLSEIQSIALLSIFPVCAVSYIQEPARLRSRGGGEKSLVEGAKPQSGQTLGLEELPQSNHRREELTGIRRPQARRLPGSRERERESALRACALGTSAWQSDSRCVCYSLCTAILSSGQESDS